MNSSNNNTNINNLNNTNKNFIKSNSTNNLDENSGYKYNKNNRRNKWKKNNNFYKQNINQSTDSINDIGFNISNPTNQPNIILNTMSNDTTNITSGSTVNKESNENNDSSQISSPVSGNKNSNLNPNSQNYTPNKHNNQFNQYSNQYPNQIPNQFNQFNQYPNNGQVPFHPNLDPNYIFRPYYPPPHMYNPTFNPHFLLPYQPYNNQIVPFKHREHNNLNNSNNNLNSNCGSACGEKNKFTGKESSNESNKDVSNVVKDYMDKINNKLDEMSKKESMWISFEIKTLNDLIKVAKDYGVLYSKEYEYQLDLNLLSGMLPELESLNNMIGLNSVKTQIVDLILFYGLKLDNKNHDLLHTVIEGEPGTGKTELAEKLAKIYLKMGILKKDVFKKVRRSDLIAGYLGQTAIKTEKVLEECKGGVLFIDEAYSLGNAEGKDGRDSFSKECIDMLNQWLTENKSEFVCIIAGYKDDLSKSFFSYNTGLERRFPIRFSIESYSDDELAKIFVKKIKEFEWDIDCTSLSIIIKSNRKYFKFNGGDMEVLFAKCKIAHSKNLLKEKDKTKKLLTESDILDGVKIFLANPEIKKRGESNTIMSTIYV